MLKSSLFSVRMLFLYPLNRNFSVFAGTWIANSEKTPFLLIGNEAEGEMRLDAALQADDDAYQIIAQSKKIISYGECCAGDVEMLDKRNDGSPYFWYSAGYRKNIYVSISKLEENDWSVYLGCVESSEEDADFSYCAMDGEDAMMVYEIYSPKICWPIQRGMSLEGFDLSVSQEECMAALDYPHRFTKTHGFVQWDAMYTILWE